ncbi:Ankyrin repeat-containing protein [Cladophialophora immunda]|nr:Ankyrin repeat-containing protein [Cladophialophora immunda]
MKAATNEFYADSKLCKRRGDDEAGGRRARNNRAKFHLILSSLAQPSCFGGTAGPLQLCHWPDLSASPRSLDLRGLQMPPPPLRLGTRRSSGIVFSRLASRYLFRAPSLRTNMTSGPTSADEDEDEAIYNLADECESLFQQVLLQQQSLRAASLRIFEEYHQRFMSWTAYLGVLAKRSVCLDRRLRHHPDLRDLVLRLLDILKENLLQICDFKDPRHQKSLSRPSPSKNGPEYDLPAVTTDVMEGINGAIDRLNRLGIAIRQSSTRSLMAGRYSDVSDVDSFKELAGTFLRSLYPDANYELLDLLSRSMAERFDKVSSRQGRQAVLQERRQKVTSPLQPIIEEEEANERLVAKARMPSELRRRLLAGKLPRSMPVQREQNSLPSEVSSIDRQVFQQKMKSGSSNASSRHKETLSIQISQVGYPKAPQANNDSGYLTCEWCFETRERRYFEGEKWRKHVDEDLRPYVCISERCSDPICSFSSFTKWQAHMHLEHGLSWHQHVYPAPSWVCAVCHDVLGGFHAPEELYKHLKEEHPFTEAQLEAIVRQSRVHVRRRPELCPLCCLPVEDDPVSSSKSAAAQQRKVMNPGKHQQEPTPLESSPKRARTSVENGKLALSALDNTTQNDTDEQAESEGIKEPALTRTEMMARHVVAHLQGLMSLTIRLMSIRDHDANSVSIGSSSAYGTDVSTRDIFSQDGSEPGSRTRVSLSDQGSSDDESDGPGDPAVEIPDTEVDIDWGSVTLAGESDEVPQLLEEDIDAELSNESNHLRALLLYTAAEGSAFAVRELLEQCKVDINSTDINGQTPLSHAAQSGRLEIVRYITESRDDVEIDSKDIYGQTPLSHAAQRGCEAVVRYILRTRTDVEIDSKDIYGQTPLSHAAQSGCQEVVRRLVFWEADINSRDIDGQTPLSHAAETGCEEVVRFLLERGDVDIISSDNFGWTALMRAAEHGHDKIVRLLESKAREGHAG